MPGEFFDDRGLERELLDEFPTPLADVFDDLTYERAPRGRLAKVIDLFRVGVRLLAFYALAATAEEAGGAGGALWGPGPGPTEALVRLRKLARQRITEGDWIGLARETLRPFARTPAPFPIPEIVAVFFRPGTEQPSLAAAALERLLKTRNEWAHGVSGTEAEVQAVVDQCRPDLETLVSQLRWMARAPWFVPGPPVTSPGGPRREGLRLAGITPRRGFRPTSVTVDQPLDPGVVYAFSPAGPLRLGPLVQFLVPPSEARDEGKGMRDEREQASSHPSSLSPHPSPELFLLETGGRREARLQAFPSGREVGSREAQEWLARRAATPEEPEERGPRFDVPMIDRHSECEQFRRLLRRVMEDRQGQVLIIEGEAGIGKTKFVRFCREAAAPLPVRVMHGAYRDHAGGAYAAVREALEDLFGVEMLEREAVSQRIEAALPELGYADSAAEAVDLTAFVTQFLRPAPGAGKEGQEGLDYVVGRVERFLRRVSLHVPLLLLLEDLHWADAESLALLQNLAAVLATDPARLLIIATMRAEDRELNRALETALQRMARFEGTFYRRVFGRLGEGETATLIEESLQADLEDKAAVYRLAEGNPLHVLSILRYLSSEELLEPTAAGWRVKPGVPLVEILPATVREVIGLRVKHLATQDEEGPARRETLTWAAAAGRRFDAGVLAEAIREGAPHLSARLDAHLDALLDAGLLRECPSLPGDVLEFDHHLLREVVLAEREGPRAERARHRCLAAAKIRRVERGDRDLLPEVAHHFLEARDWTEAVRYHRRAGDSARDSMAFREAAGFYETAADLISEHTSVPLSVEEQADLYEAQAEALETLGRMDEALAAYHAAQAQAGEDRVRWARNERCVAWLLSRKGRLDEAAVACERARDVLEAAAVEVDLADVLRTLGQVEILRGRYEVAAIHLQRSLAICQRGDHRESLARCYGTLAQLYEDRGDLEALLDVTQRELAIFQSLGRPVSVGKGLNSVAWALIRLGRHEEALPLLFGAAEIFEQHPVDYVLPHVYHSLAEALLNCGRSEEAREYLERGLESARRIGQVRTVANFHRLLARQAVAAGRSDEARVQFEEALRVCEGTGLEPQQAQIYLEYGEFLRTLGDRAEAVRQCEAALLIRKRLGTDDVSEAEAALARARGTDDGMMG
jgi:tetratricopeptide (TPR) repeat protein